MNTYREYLMQLIKYAEQDLAMPSYKYDEEIRKNYNEYKNECLELMQTEGTTEKEVEQAAHKLYELRNQFNKSNVLRIEEEVVATEDSYVSKTEADFNYSNCDVLKINGSKENAKEIFVRFILPQKEEWKTGKNLSVKLGLRNDKEEKPQPQNVSYIEDSIDLKSISYSDSRAVATKDEHEFDTFAIKSAPFYCKANNTPWIFSDITELYKTTLCNKEYAVFKIYSTTDVDMDTEYCSVLKGDKYDYPYRHELEQVKRKPRIFVSYDIDAKDKLKLEIERANNILKDTPAGDEIWQYSAKVREVLKTTLEAADLFADREENEECLVERIKEVQAAIAQYYRDINVPKVERPALLYTKEQLSEIRNRMDEIPEFKENYKRIKETLDQLDIDAFEEKFKMPRWAGFLNLSNRVPFVFDAPEAAEKAFVEIIISGKADVAVDDAVFSELIGNVLDFPNGSFEIGDEWPVDWQLISKNSTTVFHWENTDNKGERARSGKRSVRVINKEKTEVATLRYAVPFEVTPGVRYKFDCQLSYSEPFSDAAYLKVIFMDAKGNEIDTKISHPENNPYENRPTEVREPAMYAAVAYMKEGTMHYAQIAKRLLDLMLDSLLNILVKIDTGFYWSFFQTIGVQTIHTSNFFTQCVIIYDVIASSGVYSESENTEIREKMYAAMDYLKNAFSFSEVHHNNKGNMNCSRAAALAIAALALKDDYRAREYFEYGLDQMKYVFLHNFRYEEDGSWRETENYNWAVMETIFMMGVAMMNDADLNTNKEDLFVYKDVLVKNMEFLIRVASPQDRYNSDHGNKTMFPGVGDSGWNCTNYYYYLAYAYKDTNPELASKLMLSWKRTDNLIAHTDYHILPFIFIDYDIPEKHDKVDEFVASAKFDGRGLCIFRQNVGKDDEDYILMTYTNRKAGHAHADVGGLSIYLDGIPVCIDPGVDGYSAGSLPFYTSARAHSLVTLNGVTADAGTIREQHFYTSDALDYAVLELDEVENVTKEYKRHLAFVKNGFDIVVVWDDTKAKHGTSCVFQLATLTDEKTIVFDKNRFVGDLLADSDKQIEIVMPNQDEDVNCSIQKVKNPQVGFPRNEVFSFQNYMQVESTKGNSEFFTIIHLKDKNGEGLVTEKIDVDNPSVTAYKIIKDDGRYVTVVINRGSEWNTFQSDDVLLDLETNETYENKEVKIAPESMKFFMKA